MSPKYVDLCEYPLEALASGDSPIAIDTETPGLARDLRIPIYYSWAAKDLGAGAGPPTTAAGFEFLAALCTSHRPKIFHNAKFDLTVLEKLEVPINGELHDTLLMHMLLNEHHMEHHALKPLVRELLGQARMDEFALRRVWGAKNKANFNIDQEILHPYAVLDAANTLALYELFKPQLIAQGCWDVYRTIEMPVQLVYKLLDETGIMINVKFARDAIEGMKVALDKLAAQVYEAYGEEFLISSPQQLGRVLKKYFPLREKTPTGQWKTGADILKHFLSDPKMQLIQGWKFLANARSKAVGYEKHVVDGRIHPDYKQTTKTGRCNCHAPNLTVIPKQRGRITEVEVGNKELATLCGEAFRKVRKIFIAPKGAILTAFDYSQIEYRIFVHYTGSGRLIERLRAGEDFHSMICEMVFGEVTKRLRHITKVINYGILYGMGKDYLNQMLKPEGITAGSVLPRYEANFPEMRITQNRMINTARQRGYIADVFGRRYRLVPEWGYKIVSWICQGSAANVKKTAMIRTNKLLQGRRIAQVLDVHDDLTFETFPEDVMLLTTIKRLMENFSDRFDVPLPVECSVGHNLLEMEEIELDAHGLGRIQRLCAA
ncbi:hypothetical protein LCGC14_1892110 [marine sediment metagenome]|uniref:DNA-directed DNA polymerase n=1 Tax=marine sediment metagenome TaxID=412755 RepID=A0A0F9GME1_9ZZZZ